MSENISANNIYQTQIPSLTDAADIQDAFKLYHFGSTTEPASASVSAGIAKHLYDLQTTKAAIAGPTFTGTLTAPTINASTALQIGGVAITSTAAELNILDGVTSSTAELNLVDGSSAGTIVNSKALIYGAAGEVNATTLKIAGTSVLAAGTPLPGTYGGTGVNNSGKTITLGGNLTTSGAYSATLILSATTNVTLPSSGTLATLTGIETFTNKTLTTPIISTISNTGTLTLPTSTDTLVGRATTDTLTNKSISGTTNTFSNIPNSATTATNLNTASAIVARDSSGNFAAGTITATFSGNITGNVTGNVSGTSSGISGNQTANTVYAGPETGTATTATFRSLVTADIPSLDAAKITTGTFDNARIASAITGKTYNGLSLTSATTGFTIAGGTTSKTLTVSNTITLSGTDSSNLNIGTGGNLGSAAFTSSGDYQPIKTNLTSIGNLPNSAGFLYNNGTGTFSYTSDLNTTYSQSAVTTTGGALLRLTGSDATNDDVKLASSGATTVSYTDANTITISSANTTYTFASGTTNGAFSVTPSGSTAQSVSIYGLGTAAFKNTGTTAGTVATGDHTHTLAAVTDVTSTATQLNYLTSATGTTGTASTNIVFSTSPTFSTSAIFGTSTFTIGQTATTSSTINLGTAATASAATKTLNIGTGSAAGSITNVNLGSTTGTSTVTANGTLNISGTLSLNGTAILASGTPLAGAYGGTGVANTGKTITLGGNLTTSGAFATTLTVTGATNVTLPTSGVLVASGTIDDADISASASIADTKLATISTADKVSLSALNINGGTDIGTALADTDLIIVDDGGAGTNRKAAISRIPTYVFTKVSGDVSINSSGVATLSSKPSKLVISSDVTDSISTTSSITKTSSALGVDNAGLISLAASTTYKVEFAIRVYHSLVAAGGNGDASLTFRFALPSGTIKADFDYRLDTSASDSASAVNSMYKEISSSSTDILLIKSVASASDTGYSVIRGSGIIRVGATAGYAGPKFFLSAGNLGGSTSSAAFTTSADSYFIVDPI